MPSVVLLDLTTARDAAWRAALERCGVHLGVARRSDNLVQCTNVEAPQQLICLASGVTELWTLNRDFTRFPALKTRNPLP